MTDFLQITQAVRDHFNDADASVSINVGNKMHPAWLVITYHRSIPLHAAGERISISGRGASVEEALADMKRIHMNLRKQELVTY